MINAFLDWAQLQQNGHSPFPTFPSTQLKKQNSMDSIERTTARLGPTPRPRLPTEQHRVPALHRAQRRSEQEHMQWDTAERGGIAGSVRVSGFPVFYVLWVSHDGADAGESESSTAGFGGATTAV